MAEFPPTMNDSEDIDNARVLRLVLGWIDEDKTQLVAVAGEVARDPRGSDRALWLLVFAATVGLGGTWLQSHDRAALIAGIQRSLLTAASDEGEI